MLGKLKVLTLKLKPILEDAIPEEVEKIARRAESRRSQIVAKAKEQLASPEFGAYKNKPLASP